MVAVAIIIFNGCQKDELVGQLADEQPQAVVKPDVYVEEDYLVFKNFSALDSLKKLLNYLPVESVKGFETQLGFKSAFSKRNELMKKADEMTQSQISMYLEEVSKQGYFDKETQMFSYPFYNESYAKVLSPSGKLKIGNIFYRFEGTMEFVTLDLAKFKSEIKLGNFEQSIQLVAELPQLKGGEMLKETMIKDNQLRTLLQLKREEFAVYDYIIDNGQVVWGIVGYKWQIYYRFYSYRQYLLYKSDRPTYFNWKTHVAKAGGNDDFWYLNYYNANPPTERSTSEAAVFYFVTYDSGLIQSQNPVAVIQYIVSDFWSDHMINFHGSLTYN